MKKGSLLLKLIKKFFFKKEDAQKELEEAINLHLQNKLDIALTQYKMLYEKFKKEGDKVRLAIVLNNIIAIEHKKNNASFKLYKELLELRFQLFMKNEEQFAKDYVYTLLMGVEWFNEAKENIQIAKKLLELFKNEPFYNDAMQKIKALEALDA